MVHRQTSFGLDPAGVQVVRQGTCRVVIARGLLYGFFEPSSGAPGTWFRLGRGASVQTPSKDEVTLAGDGWTVTGRNVIQVFTESFQDHRATALRDAVAGLSADLPPLEHGRALPAQWDELAPGLWATPDRRHAALADPNASRAERLDYLDRSATWLPSGQLEVERASTMGGDLARPSVVLPEGWATIPFVTSFSPGFSPSAPSGAALGVWQYCFPQLAADGSLVLEDGETVIAVDAVRAAGVFEPATDGDYWSSKFHPFGQDDRVVITSARVVLAPAGAKAVNLQLRLPWIKEVFSFRQTDAALKKKMLGLMPAQPERNQEYLGFRLDSATFGDVALLIEVPSAADAASILRAAWRLPEAGETKVAEKTVLGRGRRYETKTFACPHYVGPGMPVSLLGAPV